MDHPRNRLAPLRNESKLRRETFQNGWPPDKSFLSIDELVNQGFYFLGPGNGDRVQCVYCAGILSNWEPNDNILTEHKRNFPQCPMMKSPYKMAAYRDLSTRKASFTGWPPQMRQKPDDLAEAGLFYLGQGDKAKCFWCGGMLSEWEANDIPIVEHAKSFPQCQWLMASKGKEFVERIQQHVQQGIPVQNVSMDQTVASASSLAHAASPVSSAQLEAVLMGFDQLTVSEAMKTLGNPAEINLESLVQAILEVQSSQASGNTNMVNNLDVGALTLQNREMRDRTICKICGQRQVNLVFLPCGHLVCCIECGAEITHCLICNVQVFKKVPVYM